VPRSKNEWSYTPLPQYAFMAWCSVKAQGKVYLYLLPIVTPLIYNIMSGLIIMKCMDLGIDGTDVGQSVQ
jgi:hypothetical protein